MSSGNRTPRAPASPGAATTPSPRVVALVYGYLLHRGGVESHLLSLIESRVSPRREWLVVARTSEEFRRAAARPGVVLLDGPAARFHSPLAALRLRNLLLARGVELVHVHGPRGLVAAALAGTLARIPVVATVHLPYPHLISQHPLSRALRVAVHHSLQRVVLRRLVCRTIFVSQRFRDEAVAARAVDPRRASVVPNGIELGRYGDAAAGKAVRDSLGARPTDVVAAFVGRLDEQKGLDVLIEALALRPLPGELRVWLVGEGSNRADLERNVTARGQAAHVSFLGHRNDVPALLAASDLFVLPSRVEATPIALIEAMASGLPVVVTDVGDCARLAPHRIAGLVVPPGDAAALASALVELAGDARLRRRMGENSRALAQAYDVGAMCDATERQYSEALSHAGCT
jgi:glycosyltransferase involved in cell wall biosynthesis